MGKCSKKVGSSQSTISGFFKSQSSTSLNEPLKSNGENCKTKPNIGKTSIISSKKLVDYFPTGELLINDEASTSSNVSHKTQGQKSFKTETQADRRCALNIQTLDLDRHCNEIQHHDSNLSPTHSFSCEDKGDIIPETPLHKHTGNPTVDAMCKETSEDDELICVPGTPQNPLLSKKKLYKSSRSFLFSASSLDSKPKSGANLKAKATKKKGPQRKFEEALRDKTLPSSEEKFLGQVSMVGIMSDMGLGSHQRAQLGITCGFPREMPDTTRSPRKRSHSKGTSPNPKRISSKLSPSKNLKTKPFASRGAEMVHNSKLTIGKKTNSIAGSSVTTIDEIDEVKENIKWGLKRKSFSVEADLKTQSPVEPHKNRARKNIFACSQVDDEDALDDILTELKATLSPDSVRSKLEKKNQALRIGSSHVEGVDSIQKSSSTVTASGIVARAALLNDDDDEALDEIMSELKTKALMPAKKQQPSSVFIKKAKRPSQLSDIVCDMKSSNDNTMGTEVTAQSTSSIIDTLTSVQNKANVSAPCQEHVRQAPNKPRTTIKGNCLMNSELDEIAQCFNEMSPFKMQKKECHHGSDKFREPATKFGRHKVITVENDRDNIILGIEDVFDKRRKTLILKGFWSDSQINEGDILNVLGDFNEDNICQVTDEQNLVVIHPDLLISGTSVVNSVHCMRKSVLNEKFKGCDSGNVFMMYGSIIHSIFQQILQTKAFSRSAMEEIIDNTLKQSWCLQEMYSQDVTEATVRKEIEKYIPQIVSFVEKYMSSQQQQLSCVQKNSVDTVITKVADIEESVWSPRYGIKGKIDLTVEVKIQDKGCQKWKTKVMPLELKTGKASFSIEHKGQVILYSMMFGDRRVDPESGLLLYLKEGKLETIPAIYSQKRGLIQLRNELAHYLKTSTERFQHANTDCGWKFGNLPSPINRENMCSKCPQLLNCSLYQRTIEDWSLQSDHIMQTLVPQTLSHLKPVHLTYFSHWCKLLDMELAHTQKRGGIKSLWCETGVERELKGECLSYLELQCKYPETAGDMSLQVFKRHQMSPSKLPLSDVGLTKNDSVVISALNKTLIAIATGSIIDIDADSVTLTLDRDLTSYPEYKDLVYRLDKLDYFNSLGINFTNLSKLLSNTAHSSRLRELIIERKKPEFDLTLSKSSISKVKEIFKLLNKPQKTAILKVLMSRDYVLIKGYPGTGKTSTIVSLVRVLTALGQSVLLASYTHSAVDNILLKLKKYDVDFMRLGRVQRIHSDIRSHSAEILTKDVQNVDELRELFNSKPVVATTCLGTNHSLFSHRQFDVCVIDEASQILQPACFGPLMCSRKFVLVGDPLQLAPVVTCNEAKEQGLDESLFSRLDDTGATYELTLQYRMNSDVMRLCNELVYGGALACGSTTVSAGKLQLINTEALCKVDTWLQQALDPGNGVVWLNTENLFADMTAIKTSDDDIQSRADCGMKNEAEAKLVLRLVIMSLKCGLKEDAIGVITPYRQQVWLLRELLRRNNMEAIEVNTVDQYQGRDKEMIIMSFVKFSVKDSENKSRGILQDIRRLNVAITRARHKLILIGSVSALMPYQPVASLIGIIEPKHIFLLDEFACSE